MILGELIQRVQSLYSKGVQSDDSKLYPGHIYSKLVSVRAMLIFQKSNKKQIISPWNYQTLPCIQLEKVNPNDCPCLPAIGCKIVRTAFRLPEAISNMDRSLIQSVSSVEGSIEYSESTWEEQKYKKGRKYTKSKPEYYIRNQYLYLNMKKGAPKTISLTGLFLDPILASTFPSICDDCNDCQSCDSLYELDFPIDNELVEPLLQMTTQELVIMFSQLAHDDINNSKDDISPIPNQRQQDGK